MKFFWCAAAFVWVAAGWQPACSIFVATIGGPHQALTPRQQRVHARNDGLHVPLILCCTVLRVRLVAPAIPNFR